MTCYEAGSLKHVQLRTKHVLLLLKHVLLRAKYAAVKSTDLHFVGLSVVSDTTQFLPRYNIAPSFSSLDQFPWRHTVFTDWHVPFRL